MYRWAEKAFTCTMTSQYVIKCLHCNTALGVSMYVCMCVKKKMYSVRHNYAAILVYIICACTNSLACTQCIGREPACVYICPQTEIN